MPLSNPTGVADLRAQIPTVISSGQTVSAEIDLGGTELVGVDLPASMTGTALSFQMALVSGGTYQPVQDGSGSAITFTISSGQYIGIDPTHFHGVRFLKLVSGTSEGADRAITVVTRADLMSRVARHTITLVTAPAAEPITLDEVKAWAKIDTDADDPLVTQLITSARMSAEEYLRRTLLTTSYKLTLDLASSFLNNTLPEGSYDLPITSLYGGLHRNVELPKGPVQSITSVTTYALDNSSSVYDPSNYFLDTAGARLVLNLGCIWPANMRPRAAAEIVYAAGYGDTGSTVPQPIRMGMMIHVASMYEQRGQSADAMDIPPGTLQQYRHYRILGDRV